jgi:hypothetical protein
MLQGVAKCYAQKLSTKNVIAFFPSETQKKIIYVWHGSCSIYRYKKERMKMREEMVFFVSDCCGVESDKDHEVCSRCGEHCEIITETYDIVS